MPQHFLYFIYAPSPQGGMGMGVGQCILLSTTFIPNKRKEKKGSIEYVICLFIERTVRY